MKLDWQTPRSDAMQLTYLRAEFAGLSIGEEHPVEFPAGRAAALTCLHEYDPKPYGRTRNFTSGAVSRLSPYVRHGLLSMVEIRDHLRQRFHGQIEVIEEFLKQLAWRDFFLHVLDWYGAGIHDDLEEAKHLVPRSTKIPLDVLNAETTLPCVDGMLKTLYRTGMLHNHERLWFAAYLCHYRGVRWQEGASLFRQHLLDGDLGSNSSSWQWVESTFAAKPYFMNQENIAKFSDNQWCASCRVRCPFRGSYPELENKLFHQGQAPLAKSAS